MSNAHDLQLPLKDEDIKKLKAGDKVLLTGIVYTARDAAHMRIYNAVKKRKKIPIDPKGQIIFYAGPTPSPKSGRLIGSIGPTTASRMDPFLEFMFKQGVKATIGKGRRSDEARRLHKKYKTIYFAATGGVAALMSRYVTSAKRIAYEDLGSEAILQLKFYKFPLTVAYDSKGGDAFAKIKI